MRGLSIDAFAEAAGVSQGTITRALRGSKVNAGTFGKIVIALGKIPTLDVPDGLLEVSA